MRVAHTQAGLIGQTDLVKIPSLSKLTGCDIYLKCEYQNPGGSVKDRAALQMVTDALDSGELKPGMTIVEGTAGNTGIGLAIVAKAFGLKMLAVMPDDQAKEKEQMITLHGGTLKTVPPCPFKDENHFYHTARRLARERPDYWWANQFENLSNYKAHYCQTGPEIWQQLAGKLDIFVSVAGTGGTIAGNSRYFKEQRDEVEVWSVDPDGSGIYAFLKTGEYQSQGSSITEGIGIMRLVENFKQAKIDYAIKLPDRDLICIARYVQQHDGMLLGSSTALNVAGALFAALQRGPGKTLVTFACDLGERSASKLYNQAYLERKGLGQIKALDELVREYQSEAAAEKIVRLG